MRTLQLALLAVLALPVANAADVSLLNGKNLDGWESVGDGVWTVMHDGTLLGQRDLSHKVTPKHPGDPNQAWLYTKKEFGEFDLHVEWWTRLGGNSGVSIRDQTRAKYTFGEDSDPNRTPSHVGYEIQISNGYKDHYPSGSLYLFKVAETGYQHDNDWNTFDIQVRNDMIRVTMNGHLIMEHPGDPSRPKTGPIGLQLHDPTTVAMFRNIRIREVSSK